MAYIVDINNSYVTTGTGASFSPLNWDQFKNHLSASSYPSREYLLSGTRVLSSTGEYIVFNSLDSTTFPNNCYRTINLDSYNKNDPWKIICDNNVGFLVLSSDFVKNINIKNGFIDTGDNAFLWFIGKLGDLSIQKLQAFFTLNNVWLKSKKYTYYYFVQNFSAINSTFIAPVICENYVSGSNYINDIIKIDDYIVYGTDISLIDINNSVLTSAWYDYTANYDIVTSNNQENWTPPDVLLSSVSAIETSDINYLSDNFNTISGTIGNKNYTETWYGGTRDGVGALYFPTISGVSASATPQSGSSDDSVLIQTRDVFNDFSASTIAYLFGDGSYSASTSSVSAFHTYTVLGNHTVSPIVVSHNNWYSVNGTPTVIFTSAGYGSATFVVLDPITSATITSAHLGDRILVSATIVSGNVYNYDYDLGDLCYFSGSSNYPMSNIPIIFKTYYDYGKKLQKLTINSNSAYMSSAQFSVSSVIPANYYVDINDDYDLTVGGNGTSGSPFNFTQFVSRLSSGDMFDIYNLSGLKNIVNNTGNLVSPWYAISADPTKYFYIKAWNISAAGPWIIVSHDFNTYAYSNTILSFDGCFLKDGIIYNIPFEGYGGRIELGNTYDMYIVNQGMFSNIALSPNAYKSLVSSAGDILRIIRVNSSLIRGSTLYSDGGFNFKAPKENYNIILDDFNAGKFNPYWNSDYTNAFAICAYGEIAGSYGYEFIYAGVYNQPNNPSGPANIRWITPSASPISGDFDLEFGCMLSSAPFSSTFWNSIGVYESAVNSGAPGQSAVDNYKEIAEVLLDTSTLYPNLRVLTQLTSGGDYAHFVDGWGDGTPEITFEPWKIIYLKIKRVNGTISLYFKDGIGSSWYKFPHTAYYTEPLAIEMQLNNGQVHKYIAFQADGGLPKTIGIYLEDSVLSNFVARNDFTSAICYIYNSTFDTDSQLSTFNISAFDNSQSGWSRPLDTNYPFRPTNLLYNKERNVIFANRKLLKPFDGITIPPNPGVNHPIYYNYETGLYGYFRKDYQL